ncbi:CHAT domain-containing protein [Xylaria sp. FL0933]|nr:CHAT domain-containing protein [Xylaria sp. FL0933]
MLNIIIMLISVTCLKNSATGSEVQVTAGGKSWICTLPKEVTRSSEDGFEENIRWLVEQHAVRDPFEGTAALKVMKTLRKYGDNLFKALQLHKAFDTDKLTLPHILLEVHDEPATPTWFRGVHWEVLEDPRLYVRSKHISNLTVCRITLSLKTITKHPDHTVRDLNTAPIQILAVTARKPGFDPIPHRLVTKPMLRIMKGLGIKEQLRILRPPTFEQFENVLEHSKPGTYRIVHLDVHGSVDDTGAKLHFLGASIDDEKVKWEVDRQPAAKIGRLLANHGVTMVVLNACESASEGDDPTFNLARVLVHEGVETVVAMAYEVLQTAAFIFTQAFYYQLLKHKSSPLVAVKFSRDQLLSHRARNTRFGTTVDVDDYFVPVIYRNQCSSSATTLETTEQHFTRKIDMEEEYAAWLQESDTEHDAFIGREADLLSLEISLYYHVHENMTGTKDLKYGAISRIIGQAGIGKTLLIEEAVEWWQDTGMIRGCLFIKNYNDVKAQLCEALGLPSKTPFPKLKKELDSTGKRSKPLLIIFDEATSGEPGSNMKYGPQLQRVLLDSETEVIITSRMPQAWQSNLSTSAEPLQPLSRDDVIELGAHYIKSIGVKDIQVMSRQDIEGFSNICKLAFGNPLALRLLMEDFSSSKFSPEAYFMRLMRGHSINIADHLLIKTTDSSFHSSSENLQAKSPSSVQELSDFLQLPSSKHAWLLLPFWFRLPNQSLRDYCCWYVESYWGDDIDVSKDKAEPPPLTTLLNILLKKRTPKVNPSSERLSALLFYDSTKFPVKDVHTGVNVVSSPKGALEKQSPHNTITSVSNTSSNPFQHDDRMRPDDKEDNPFLDESIDSSDETRNLHQDDFNNPFGDETASTAVSESGDSAPEQHNVSGIATSWLDFFLKTIGNRVKENGERKVRKGAISPSLIPETNRLTRLNYSTDRLQAYDKVWDDLCGVLDWLEKAGFIVPGTTPGNEKPNQKSKSPHCFVMHPLLPLLLRNGRSSLHHVARDAVRTAYPRFTTYRIKHWPLGELHAHEAWKMGPLATIDGEFLNFLAAANFMVEGPVGAGLESVVFATEWEEFGDRDDDDKGDADFPYLRLAQLTQMLLVLQKGILGDHTRHAVVVSFWKETVNALLQEIQALKRPQVLNVRSVGGVIDITSSWLQDVRQEIPDYGFWNIVLILLIFIGERAVSIVWLLYQTFNITWRVVAVLLFLRDISTVQAVLSLANFSKQIISTTIDRLFTKPWTNSRAPILNLGTEIITMLLLWNLVIHCDEEQDKRRYLAEARSLFRHRTKIPVLDGLVRAGALEVLEMMASVLRPATESDIQAMLEKRQRFYGGLALFQNHDVRPYLQQDYGVPGLSAGVAGLLGLRNSLTSPYEAILRARAASQAAIDADPGPGGIAEAKKILSDTLDRELHDKNVAKDVDDGRKGGSVASNVAYLHRGLSAISRQAGDWQQALRHWEEAARVEEMGGVLGGGTADGGARGGKDGRLTKSWHRSLGDTATFWGLKAMASIRK